MYPRGAEVPVAIPSEETRRPRQSADDKAALSQQQREEMEAQIMADTLMIERSECALIWHAEAQGETIDFRSDTTPMALLGLRLVNQPRANPVTGNVTGAYVQHHRRAMMNTDRASLGFAACNLPGIARNAETVLGDPASRPPLTQTAPPWDGRTGDAQGWGIAIHPCPVRPGAVQSALPASSHADLIGREGTGEQVAEQECRRGVLPENPTFRGCS
jgi:hypothetical protein